MAASYLFFRLSKRKGYNELLCRYLFIVFSINLALGMILLVTPLYLMTLNISGISFGLIIGAVGIGAIISKIPVGMLSDKLGGKKIVFLGCAILFSSSVFFPLVSDLSVLIVLRILQGIGMSMILVSLTTMFIGSFGETSNIGLFSAALGAGIAVIGPLAGGILSGLIGIPYTFFFGASLVLFSMGILNGIKEHEQKENPQKEKHINNTLNWSSLARASIFGLTNMAALYIFISFIPLIIPTVSNLSSSWSGLMFFLEGLTYVLLVTIIGKMADGFGKERLALMGSIATIFVFLLFSISRSLLELAFASILMGAITALIIPTSLALAAEAFPEKGKAIGIFNTSRDAGMIIGPTFAGLTSELFGLKYAFLSMIPILLLGWLLILIFNNKSKI